MISCLAPITCHYHHLKSTHQIIDGIIKSLLTVKQNDRKTVLFCGKKFRTNKQEFEPKCTKKHTQSSNRKWQSFKLIPPEIISSTDCAHAELHTRKINTKLISQKGCKPIWRTHCRNILQKHFSTSADYY